MIGKTSTTQTTEITGKIFCDEPSCKIFLGFTRSDGSGPIFSGCAKPRLCKACPAMTQLLQWEPKPKPNLFGGGGPLDEDAGSYGSIARRELEDGIPD